MNRKMGSCLLKEYTIHLSVLTPKTNTKASSNNSAKFTQIRTWDLSGKENWATFRLCNCNACFQKERERRWRNSKKATVRHKILYPAKPTFKYKHKLLWTCRKPMGSHELFLRNLTETKLHVPKRLASHQPQDWGWATDTLPAGLRLSEGEREVVGSHEYALCQCGWRQQFFFFLMGEERLWESLQKIF